MSEACPREPMVRRAAIEGRWTDVLRVHVSECDDCAAASAVAGFLDAMARTDARQRPLPDPALLWLQGQILRGQVVADRAARPLNVVQIASYALVAAGWAALVTWKWDELQRWLFSLTPAGVLGELAGAGSAVSVGLVVTVVALGSLTVTLALHAILAEE